MTFEAACMTPEERALWEAARDLDPDRSRRPDRPCVDCPAWFARSMEPAGRCNGTPRDGRVGRLPGDGRGRLGWVAA